MSSVLVEDLIHLMIYEAGVEQFITKFKYALENGKQYVASLKKLEQYQKNRNKFIKKEYGHLLNSTDTGITLTILKKRLNTVLEETTKLYGERSEKESQRTKRQKLLEIAQKDKTDENVNAWVDSLPENWKENKRLTTQYNEMVLEKKELVIIFGFVPLKGENSPKPIKNPLKGKEIERIAKYFKGEVKNDTIVVKINEQMVRVKGKYISLGENRSFNDITSKYKEDSASTDEHLQTEAAFWFISVRDNRLKVIKGSKIFKPKPKKVDYKAGIGVTNFFTFFNGINDTKGAVKQFIPTRIDGIHDVPEGVVWVSSNGMSLVLNPFARIMLEKVFPTTDWWDVFNKQIVLRRHISPEEIMEMLKDDLVDLYRSAQKDTSTRFSIPRRTEIQVRADMTDAQARQIVDSEANNNFPLAYEGELKNILHTISPIQKKFLSEWIELSTKENLSAEEKNINDVFKEAIGNKKLEIVAVDTKSNIHTNRFKVLDGTTQLQADSLLAIFDAMNDIPFSISEKEQNEFADSIISIKDRIKELDTQSSSKEDKREGGSLKRKEYYNKLIEGYEIKNNKLFRNGSELSAEQTYKAFNSLSVKMGGFGYHSLFDDIEDILGSSTTGRFTFAQRVADEAFQAKSSFKSKVDSEEISKVGNTTMLALLAFFDSLDESLGNDDIGTLIDKIGEEYMDNIKLGGEIEKHIGKHINGYTKLIIQGFNIALEKAIPTLNPKLKSTLIRSNIITRGI